jgi:hypothetical protein
MMEAVFLQLQLLGKPPGTQTGNGALHFPFASSPFKAGPPKGYQANIKKAYHLPPRKSKIYPVSL